MKIAHSIDFSGEITIVQEYLISMSLADYSSGTPRPLCAQHVLQTHARPGSNPAIYPNAPETVQNSMSG